MGICFSSFSSLDATICLGCASGRTYQNAVVRRTVLPYQAGAVERKDHEGAAGGIHLPRPDHALCKNVE
jgi:hypothetical protein